MPSRSNEYRGFFNGEPCMRQMRIEDFLEVTHEK